MGVDDQRRWKVGELARISGLTVRALHHYDRLGLLAPSERTASGHRLYSKDDVERLYRILALRHVGLPLADIRAVLDERGLDLVATMRRHLARVDRELDRGGRLRRRLVEMLDAHERAAEPTVDQIMSTVGEMTVVPTDLDVLMRVPYEAGDDEEPRRVKRRHPGRKVVLLKERDGDRTLPIWIGREAGYALVLGLCGQQAERPLSADLAFRMLELGGHRVERVMIETGSDDNYIATLTVALGEDSHDVDARPSDALNIAARAGGAVFVAVGTMDDRAVPRAAEVESRLREDLASVGDDDARVPGEWRSLPADLMASLGR